MKDIHEMQRLSPHSKEKNSRVCVVYELPARSVVVPD